MLGRMGWMAAWLMVFGTLGQAPTRSVVLHQKAVQKLAYVCLTDKVASEKRGKCPVCKHLMAPFPVHPTHGCVRCQIDTNHSDKCPKCGGAVASVDVTYFCFHCMTAGAEPGACEKCKKIRKRQVLARVQPLGLKRAKS